MPPISRRLVTSITRWEGKCIRTTILTRHLRTDTRQNPILPAIRNRPNILPTKPIPASTQTTTIRIAHHWNSLTPIIRKMKPPPIDTTDRSTDLMSRHSIIPTIHLVKHNHLHSTTTRFMRVNSRRDLRRALATLTICTQPIATTITQGHTPSNPLVCRHTP
jgi:hypothetical protein